MWWKGQNMDKPIIAKNGEIWEFLVWHGHTDKIYNQKIYFWNKDKSTTGIIEFNEGNTIHISKLKDNMKKLANDKSFREKFLLVLKFPLEKNYP